MTAGDDVRLAQRPLLVADPRAAAATGLVLIPRGNGLPAAWAGPVPPDGLEPAGAAGRARPAAGVRASGAALGTIGLVIPPQRALTAVVLLIEASG